MRGGGERAITTLAKAVQCSRYFARRIINAVDEGREEELLKKQKRRDAVPREVIEELGLVGWWLWAVLHAKIVPARARW